MGALIQSQPRQPKRIVLAMLDGHRRPAARPSWKRAFSTDLKRRALFELPLDSFRWGRQRWVSVAALRKVHPSTPRSSVARSKKSSAIVRNKLPRSVAQSREALRADIGILPRAEIMSWCEATALDYLFQELIRKEVSQSAASRAGKRLQSAAGVSLRAFRRTAAGALADFDVTAIASDLCDGVCGSDVGKALYLAKRRKRCVFVLTR